MPLVKSGVKALGKQGLKTGMQIAGDVLGGQKPKQAAQRRTKQAGLQTIRNALGQQPPGMRAARGRQQSQARGRGRGRGRGGTKRSAPSRPVSSSQSKRRKDIFS